MKILSLLILFLFVSSNAFDLFGGIGDLANSAGKAADDFGSKVSDATQNLGSNIGDTWNNAVQNAGSTFNNLKDTLGNKLGQIANSTKEIAGNMGQELNQAFGENGAVRNWTAQVGGDFKNSGAWNWTQQLGDKLKQKFNDLEGLASKTKAQIASKFHNESIIAHIAETLNDRHNEVANGSNPYWRADSDMLTKFKEQINNLKSSNNFGPECASVRDKALSVIESEDEILTPWAYKGLFDDAMNDAGMTNLQKVDCYKELFEAATQTSR